MPEILRRKRNVFLLAVPTVLVAALFLFIGGRLLSQEPGTTTHITAVPTNPTVGQPVGFSATVVTPQVEVGAQPTVFRYVWDFGDGVTAITLESGTTHYYGWAGTYSAKVILQKESAVAGEWEAAATSEALLISVTGGTNGDAPLNPPDDPSGGGVPPPNLPTVTIGSQDPSFSSQTRSTSVYMGHPTVMSYTTDAVDVPFQWSAEGAVQVDQNGTITATRPGEGTVRIKGTTTIDWQTYSVSDQVTVYVSDLSVVIGQPWNFTGGQAIDISWPTCPTAVSDYCQGFYEVTCYLATHGFPDCQTDQSGNLTHVSPEDTTGWWIASFFIDPGRVNAWAHWGDGTREGGRIDGYYAGSCPLWSMPVPDDVNTRVYARCAGYAPGCPCESGCTPPEYPIYASTMPAHDHGQVTWIVDGQVVGPEVDGPTTAIEKDTPLSSAGYHAYRIKPVRQNWAGWVALQARYECGSATKVSPIQWIKYNARCPATTIQRTIALSTAFSEGQPFAGQTTTTIYQTVSVSVTATADVRDPQGSLVTTPLTYHWTLSRTGGPSSATEATAPNASFNIATAGDYVASCWASDADGNLSSVSAVSIRFVQYAITIKTKRSDLTDWDQGTTAVAAGGVDNAIHKADVRIEFDPPLDGDREVRVSLSGGEGYVPTEWWWKWFSRGARARLTVEGSTYVSGTTSEALSFRPTSALTGTLLSSNRAESARVHVQVPSLGIEADRSVVSAAPTVWGVALDGMAWAQVESNGSPVSGHLLCVVITSVTLGDDEPLSPSLTGSAATSSALTEYVEFVGGVSPAVAIGFTDEYGSLVVAYSVKSPYVSRVAVSVYDMFVGQEANPE